MSPLPMVPPTKKKKRNATILSFGQVFVRVPTQSSCKTIGPPQKKQKTGTFEVYSSAALVKREKHSLWFFLVTKEALEAPEEG